MVINQQWFQLKEHSLAQIKSPIKEIVKEKKVKKDIPQRAKNDPRQKDL